MVAFREGVSCIAKKVASESSLATFSCIVFGRQAKSYPLSPKIIEPMRTIVLPHSMASW